MKKIKNRPFPMYKKLDLMCGAYTASGKHLVNTVDDRTEGQGSSGSGSKGVEEIPPPSPVRGGTSSGKKRSRSTGRRKSTGTSGAEVSDVIKNRNDIMRSFVDKDSSSSKEVKDEIEAVKSKISESTGTTAEEKFEGMMALVGNREMRWWVLAMDHTELFIWLKKNYRDRNPPPAPEATPMQHTYYSPQPQQRQFRPAPPHHASPQVYAHSMYQEDVAGGQHSVPRSRRLQTPCTPFRQLTHVSPPVYSSPPLNVQPMYYTNMLAEHPTPEALQGNYQFQEQAQGSYRQDYNTYYGDYVGNQPEQVQPSPQQGSGRRRRRGRAPLQLFPNE